jgi:hypothetical protein
MVGNPGFYLAGVPLFPPMPNVSTTFDSASADLWSCGYLSVAFSGYRYWYGYFFTPFAGSFRHPAVR